MMFLLSGHLSVVGNVWPLQEGGGCKVKDAGPTDAWFPAPINIGGDNGNVVRV